MDIIQNIIENFFGNNEIELEEYKKIRLNEKLEIFFSYENNYMNNQKYIYDDLISTSLVQYYNIGTYINKLFENIYYVVNCENMWNEIKQIESEIKIREPLYKNVLMDKEKPIYKKSFALCMIYFCLFVIIYQISMFNYYFISRYTHNILYELRDIPIYLGLRIIIVLLVLFWSFFSYYIGILNIIYFILQIKLYILYYVFILLISAIKFIVIIVLYIFKIFYLIFVILPRLLLFIIYLISKLVTTFVLLFSSFSSFEDIKLSLNEVRNGVVNDANNMVGLGDLDYIDNWVEMLFDIEKLQFGTFVIKTGIKAFTFSIKIILSNILKGVLFINDNTDNIIDNKVINKVAGCDRNVVLEKMISLNKKTEKKTLKECFKN